MARYSRIDRSMWGDAKFRSLSRPAPNARDLWIFLLTGPHNTCVPGLFTLGEAAMAEAMEWPMPATRKCLKEIEDAGMVRLDRAARLVWLPNALKHNPPENPNVVAGWRHPWSELPECSLKDEAREAIRATLEGKSSFLEGFRIALGELPAKPSTNPTGRRKDGELPRSLPKGSPKGSVDPSPKGSPKQEQEPEQEPEPSPPQAPPAGGVEGAPRLGDREEVSSLHPAEVLATLRASSRGKISTATDSRGEAALAEVLRDLQSRAPVGESLTLSTFRTLGEWAEAGGLAWWKGNGRPGVRYLLAPGTLAKHLDEASTWLRAGRPSLSEQGPREPQGSGTPDPWAGPNITDLRLAKQRAAKAAKETVNG